MKPLIQNTLCLLAGASIASTTFLLLRKKEKGADQTPDEPTCKDDPILALTEERDLCLSLLEKKRRDEFNLQCSVTEAIDELIKTRGADSVDYLSEKIEAVIALLNHSIE